MIGVLRTIFMAIDVAVYWCVEVLLQLVMDLSSVEIFSNSVIDEFSSRIYLILGLVMLFKLMISFIQLLINPDNTKENGVGNLLKRVVISLALIFLVPSIFDLARVVQVEVIPVIPKVILGVGTSEEEDEQVENLMSSASRLMAFYAYKPFFTYQNEDCNDGSILGTSTDGGSVTIWSVVTAFQNRNVENVCSTDENGYMYSYTFLIPTVVGAYLVFVLVTIAVEVAIRAIKLGVCELLAPIPIASYIDPKSSKQTFDKWVNISIKTYLDLFIRLILIYFVIFIFMTVFEEENLSIILENVGGDFGRQGLVIVFIIVGLLQFIKQAPKFLTDMLGLSGAGNLMGMFKGDGFRALGSTLGVAGAAVGAGIGNARYAYKNSGMSKDKWWKKLGVGAVAGVRGLGGAAAATGRGLIANANGKGFRDTFTNNIRTTTGNSQRRVNKGAISKQSKSEYNSTVNDLNNQKNSLTQKRQRLVENLQDVDDQLAAAIAAGDTARIASLTNVHNNLEAKITDTDDKIKSVDEKIKTVPKPIAPVRNAISDAFNTFTGMQSVNGASILKASSDLASIRSTYYTGEAMKKLTEEGTKIKDILSMGATYSEVASAYDALRSGSVAEVNIGGTKYTASQVQEVGELFKKAEKEAAIKYINAVKAGKIKNSTIEEGFKQIYGALDGMGLDAQTKNNLIKKFNEDPGEFLKSLSDISKSLETEGKRRQAYEREQKKNN